MWKAKQEDWLESLDSEVWKWDQDVVHGAESSERGFLGVESGEATAKSARRKRRVQGLARHAGHGKGKLAVDSASIGRYPGTE